MADPICVLQPLQRLRVCNLVLSADYFQGELKFIPHLRNIDQVGCTKRKISFRDSQISSELGEEMYEEWMIGCKPSEYYASHQSEYFLSRVYKSMNEVFVYRRDVDSIVLENLFGNVRFRI